MSALFPLFLKLDGKRVLVVGAGPVAAAKLPALLAAGAHVTVIAPEVHPEIERTGATILRRAVEPRDLDRVWLVVAAALPDVNRRVARAAAARRIFVNAVDDPQSGSAYTGGVLKRGGVTIAVSTDGAAPALAGLLREALEALLPEEVDRWVDVAREARKTWLGGGIPFGQRRPLLLQALNGLYEGRAS